MRRNPTRLSHIIDRVLKQENDMNQYTPPHKHLGDAGKPGQIVNPVAEPHPMEPCADPTCVCPNVGNTEISAHAYKPVHGGYPG